VRNLEKSGLQDKVPLVSFHSISKGVSSDCGRRGGYFELTNVSEEVRALVYKLVSVGLCPPLSGQIKVDSMVSRAFFPLSLPPAVALITIRPAGPRRRPLLLALEIRDRHHPHRPRIAHYPHCATPQRPPGGLVRPVPRSLLPLPRIMLSACTIAAVKEAGKEPDALYAPPRPCRPTLPRPWTRSPRFFESTSNHTVLRLYRRSAAAEVATDLRDSICTENTEILSSAENEHVFLVYLYVSPFLPEYF
jgi:hypothetical protein